MMGVRCRGLKKGKLNWKGIREKGVRMSELGGEGREFWKGKRWASN